MISSAAALISSGSSFDLFSSSSSPPGAAASFTAVISAENFSSCHHAVFIHPSVFRLGCLLSPWKQAAILDNHMMPKLKETHTHTHTRVYQLHRFNRLDEAANSPLAMFPIHQNHLTSTLSPEQVKLSTIGRKHPPRDKLRTSWIQNQKLLLAAGCPSGGFTTGSATTHPGNQLRRIRTRLVF